MVRVPRKLARKLREDPWRAAEGPSVGDRAFFSPDGLRLEVVAVAAGAVTSSVVGPASAPELGEERTVTAAEWRGMLEEGTLRALPEPPRVGEAWTDRHFSLFWVVSVSEAEAVLERLGGEPSEAVPLGPDGLPADRARGWARVNEEAQGESRGSWESYGHEESG